MRFYLGVLVFASACTGSIASSGGGDDDNPPPPPPGSVQMVVQDGYSPQAGVRVLFQNADNTLIAEVMTDATGTATSPMPNGGNLTVIRTFAVTPPADPIPPEIYSYLGVKAGDTLHLGHDVDDHGTPSAINVKVPDGAQGTINVITPCGSGQGTGPLVPITTTGCPANVTFYVTDGNQDAFLAKAPYSVNVDLSTQQLAGTLATTLSAINVTPDMSQINAETRIMAGDFQLYASQSKRIDTTPQTVNLPTLTSGDELLLATITSTGGTEMIATRQAYVVEPLVVDPTANLIPYVANPKYTPTAITWSETGTGTADFVYATLDVQPQAQNNIAPLVPEYKRAIIAAHGDMSLTIPLLSGADAVYNPAMTDQIAGNTGLVKVTGGYDAARAYAFSLSNIVEAAPMGGAITLSYSGNTAPAL